MLRLLRSLPWLLAVATALVACDGAEDCPTEREPAPCSGCTLVASASGCPVWVCPEGCVPVAPRPDASGDARDATPSDLGGGGFDTAPPPLLPYRFVRIDDLSQNGDTADAGSDIDAVILTTPDGGEVYANTVEAFEHGGGLGDELDPVEALGAPDAFARWPDVSVCDLTSGYVSLGGSGGLLVVGMPDDIEAGDILEVLEVGGCWGNDGPEGVIEAIEISVSVGNDVDSTWVYLGSGEGPLVSLVVPILPPMP